ncbi:MAG: OB-fold nucleic acid binding domain-containing protein, partial [Actinobacteria bacterium]|nr:OB-fold nucleic acid binding domain-containing protein [Actinomycetota bacterium]
MALRDLARRLRTNHEELDRERLRERFAHRGLTPIESMPVRQHAAVGGEVTRMMVRPRSGVPAFEVVISDGTGDAIAVFTGRRSIPGIDHGRAMIIEGVARDERGRRVILNPAYTLLPD